MFVSAGRFFTSWTTREELTPNPSQNGSDTASFQPPQGKNPSFHTQPLCDPEPLPDPHPVFLSSPFNHPSPVVIYFMDWFSLLLERKKPSSPGKIWSDNDRICFCRHCGQGGLLSTPEPSGDSGGGWNPHGGQKWGQNPGFKLMTWALSWAWVGPEWVGQGPQVCVCVCVRQRDKPQPKEFP